MLADKSKFGKIFKHSTSGTAWIAFLKAFYGLAMTEEEWAIFRECTGRERRPRRRVR